MKRNVCREGVAGGDELDTKLGCRRDLTSGACNKGRSSRAGVRRARTATCIRCDKGVSHFGCSFKLRNDCSQFGRGRRKCGECSLLPHLELKCRFSSGIFVHCQKRVSHGSPNLSSVKGIERLVSSLRIEDKGPRLGVFAMCGGRLRTSF